jgi:hypothetical protein
MMAISGLPAGRSSTRTPDTTARLQSRHMTLRVIAKPSAT